MSMVGFICVYQLNTKRNSSKYLALQESRPGHSRDEHQWLSGIQRDFLAASCPGALLGAPPERSPSEFCPAHCILSIQTARCLAQTGFVSMHEGPKA